LIPTRNRSALQSGIKAKTKQEPEQPLLSTAPKSEIKVKATASKIVNEPPYQNKKFYLQQIKPEYSFSFQA